jgi:cytochrome c oxidase cbb3-type subunit 3
MSSRFPELLFVATAVLSLSCDRQDPRRQRVVSPGRLEMPVAMQGELRPGHQVPRPRMQNPFEGDAAAVAEGRRLYNWYNCAGCHFNGGGGIGPALMDGKWIYGAEPENIYDTIVRGRPNGMPAFGGRIPEQQLWQIVAYVRSLSPERPTAEQPGARSEALDTPTMEEEEGQGQGDAARPEGGANR